MVSKKTSAKKVRSSRVIKRAVKAAKRPVRSTKNKPAVARKGRLGVAVGKNIVVSKKIAAQELVEKVLREKRVAEIKRLRELVGDAGFTKSISSVVGTGALDILKLLAEGPRTDENIAERLGVKVNDVRRMLNVMNSYSIVRYDVNKDSKGWLLFTTARETTLKGRIKWQHRPVFFIAYLAHEKIVASPGEYYINNIVPVCGHNIL